MVALKKMSRTQAVKRLNEAKVKIKKVYYETEFQGGALNKLFMDTIVMVDKLAFQMEKKGK